MPEPRRIAVVGGGIAGLSAAYEATQALPDADVALYEASGRLGGKILTSDFVGLAVDEAADAFLNRVPWAVDLCRRLGLSGQLVSPAASAAEIWLDGQLVRLPQPHVMGVPTDPDALAASGVVSADAVEALRADLRRTDDPDTGRAESVASMVRRRIGDELHERLVAPLVGSVYASDCELLDLESGSPQLAAAAAADASLVRGLLSMKAQSTSPPDAPVFHSLAGGTERLVGALGEALGPRVRLNSAVRSVRAGELADADGVILTCPAFEAAPLAEPLSPEAADLLAGIEYATVTIVTVAYDRAAVEVPTDASGFLVPRGAGLDITACSYASSKWAHLRGEVTILRVSLGSHGNDAAAALDEEALLETVEADLATTMGISAQPTAVRISRWRRSFPQYAVGHLDRVARIEELLAPHGIRVAGAAYRGIGIPACVRQGIDAVRQLSGEAAVERFG